MYNVRAQYGAPPHPVRITYGTVFGTRRILVSVRFLFRNRWQFDRKQTETVDFPTPAKKKTVSRRQRLVHTNRYIMCARILLHGKHTAPNELHGTRRCGTARGRRDFAMTRKYDDGRRRAPSSSGERVSFSFSFLDYKTNVLAFLLCYERERERRFAFYEIAPTSTTTYRRVYTRVYDSAALLVVRKTGSPVIKTPSAFYKIFIDNAYLQCEFDTI